MERRLTWYILFAMLAGVALGAALHAWLPPTDPLLGTIADGLRLFADVFLRLIKMIIAPLIFATVVTGIAGMGDS
ncbi:MAG: cation:dicarboxylase symporter family transporter, partial [Proteobacteria bacterium]|nr:cation:dicarboxylase symporter family transporter [Pseudomonadota bacterium]